jgi:hypothetical protein
MVGVEEFQIPNMKKEDGDNSMMLLNNLKKDDKIMVAKGKW